MTFTTLALAADGPTSGITTHTIERRDVGPGDVRVEISHSGICHSDIHSINGDWGPQPYPHVPGHEIIGRVVEVGADVTAHKIGDRVGVGVIVGSCGECAECLQGLQQYCANEPVWTFGAPDPHMPGHTTHGGYSREIVTEEAFVFRVPENLDPAGAAPLLCAGITVYSPLKTWGAGPGKKVGIAGIGGLGHLGVKFAHALGAHTVGFTTSPDKAEMIRGLGADDVLISSDKAAMLASEGSFDVIIDTIPFSHDLNPYLKQLKVDGTLVVVGALVPITEPIVGGLLTSKRRRIAGSNIGGLPETQEMLDFAGKHNIVADVEFIRADYVNAAYERVVAGDVNFRFVIDATSIGAPVPELISAQEAADRVAAGALIVDVRPERFLADDGRNSLATWVDRKNMDAYFTAGGEHYLAEALADADREVVVMCGSIKGSRPMAQWLLENGRANVSHVDGGFAAWRDADLPISPVE
jgi:uncharacterized zinc-type alcohol dehydrogenase-like protein